MKTQIIQLGHNDDIVSVRDKMSWCQTGRILLVWPANGRILNRQLDLILLKRYAIMQGSALALVTNDDEVRFFARRIGLPVFVDVRQAQEQEWINSSIKLIERHTPTQLMGLDSLRKSIRSRTSVWVEHPVTRLLCLGVSLLALLALAIFILPGAEVVLSPKEEVQTITLDLIADPTATGINISTGNLPTYSQEVIVEGTDSITATGTMTIPDETALGMVRFNNKSKSAITLPSGTVITTVGSDRVRFLTTTLIDTVIKPGKAVLLEAKAFRAGASGNLPPDSLTAIEGDFGLGLVVTNPKATSGGVDASVPTPSEQDHQELRNLLITRLLKEGLAELQSNLPVDDVLITPSAMIVDVMEERYDPGAGIPIDRVDLSMRLKIGVQVVSGKMLLSLVNPIIDAGLPTGYTPVQNSLVITPVTAPAIGSDGKANWTVEVSRKLLADIPTALAIEYIQGASPQEAVEHLSEALPLAQPASITLLPAWWPRLPLLAMRISLTQADTQ